MRRSEKTTPGPMNALGKAKGPDRACKDDMNQHDRYTHVQPIVQPVAQPHPCTQHGSRLPEEWICNRSEPGNQAAAQGRTHASIPYRRAKHNTQEPLEDPKTESTHQTK